MQTLSLFPSLFAYEFLAITLIRVTLGLVFLWLWFRSLRIDKDKAEQIAFFEMVGLRPARLFWGVLSFTKATLGVLFIVGLWTQGAALVAAALMLGAGGIKHLKPQLLPIHNAPFCFVVAAVSLALLFLGPGALAIDLPL